MMPKMAPITPNKPKTTLPMLDAKPTAGESGNTNLSATIRNAKGRTMPHRICQVLRFML
jgi:hypothetical protein